MQEDLHTFLCLAECSSINVVPAIFASLIFHDILQLIHSLTFFCTYNFHSLNILQHHMIYGIHIHNYQGSKYILYTIHLCQSTLCIHTCIYLHSTFGYHYKYLHQVYISIYTFYTILCILFH